MGADRRRSGNSAVTLFVIGCTSNALIQELFDIWAICDRSARTQRFTFEGVTSPTPRMTSQGSGS